MSEEYYEIDYSSVELAELKRLWWKLNTLKDKWQFDYEGFKALAVRTFAFLFPFCEEEFIPRGLLPLLFEMRVYASSPSYTTHEHLASLLVARAFCDQIEDAWELIDLECDPDYFVVKCAYARNGKTEFIIDAHTFDLSEML